MLYLFAYGDADKHIASIRVESTEAMRLRFLRRLFPSVKFALIYRYGWKEEEWQYKSDRIIRTVFFSGAVATVEYYLNEEDQTVESWEFPEDSPFSFNEAFARALGDAFAEMNLTTAEDVHEQIKARTGLSTSCRLETLPIEMKYIFLRGLGKLSHKQAMRQLGMGKGEGVAPMDVLKSESVLATAYSL